MDRDFLERLKAGDEDAFKSLVTQFQDRVVSLCYRFLRNREDAEDTAQDVFVDAYRNLSGFRAEAEISTWLYRIASTKSLDAIRRRNRKKRQDGPSPVFSESDPAEAVPAAESADPGRVFEARERSLVLQNAVASLPKSQRIAITLSRYEGLGNKEIAEILHASVFSIDSLIYRAQKNLRKRLHKYYARQIKNEGEK
ncbi:MAG: sigma-70 family RNA polymerase sigma factor [Candidatus Aminicenantes bacterium]|nr:sigma-70 family RNA polymerase sigma factor [Candidatus Aminicenantes bacterium]